MNAETKGNIVPITNAILISQSTYTGAANATYYKLYIVFFHIVNVIHDKFLPYGNYSGNAYVSTVMFLVQSFA